MTHSNIPSDQKSELGITDNLIRLSIGLEDPDEIINDINVALIKAIN